MTAPHATTILGGYRRRLDEELSDLPRERRQEIIGELEAHIRDARAAIVEETDSDLLNLLDRVGEPGVIGAYARERFGVRSHAPAGGREVIGLLLLGIGAVVVPIIAPVIGLMLVWSSPAWTDREKRNSVAWSLIALVAVTLLVVVLPIVIGRLHGEASALTLFAAIAPISVLALLVVVVAPIVAALLLASALARRKPVRS